MYKQNFSSNDPYSSFNSFSLNDSYNNQSLETAEVSKDIEEEEEKVFVDLPPISTHEQLEREKTPLHIQFVISLHSTPTSL